MCPSKATTGVVSSEGTKENYVPDSLETNEEALGVETILSEHRELMAIEEVIIASITRESLRDRSIIWCS